MKSLFLFVTFLLLSTFMSAQTDPNIDTIFMSDGTVLEGKVVEIGEAEIKYKKSSNLTGPAYVVKLEKVSRIKYSDGKEESFDSRSQKPDVSPAKSAEQVVVVKNDGTEYIGILISDDGREVLIETNSIGKVYIPKSDVKSIIKVKDKSLIVNGEYRSSGPFTTRYAFTNNALPIKKGENYAMVNLFGPEVHFAASDNLNIGVMSTWIASPVVLALKYTFKKSESNVNFSAGTLLGTSGYLRQFKGYGGLHWLSMTVGSRMNNVTFSGGYFYVQSGGQSNIPSEGVYNGGYYNYYPQGTSNLNPLNKGPLFSFAGVFKVGAKASFVFDSMFLIYKKLSYTAVYTETKPGSQGGPPNYFYIPPEGYTTVKHMYNTETALLIMPGMRFQSSERKAFQFCLAGAAIFGKNDRSFPFPMCSWFYKI